MLKAAWKTRFRCRLNAEKVCESRLVFFKEFQTVGARAWKARELKTSFTRKEQKQD